MTGVQRDLEFGATSGAERHQRVVGSGLHRNLIVADILIANGDVVGAKPVPVDQIGHVGRGGATIEIIAADRRLGRDLEAFVLNHGIAKFVRQRQINHRKAGSAQREIVGKADAIGDGSSGAGLTEHEDRPRTAGIDVRIHSEKQSVGGSRQRQAHRQRGQRGHRGRGEKILGHMFPQLERSCGSLTTDVRPCDQVYTPK
ncbi:hypothetical protein [Sandarakinorhabdus limnophila]|uniref:hypothetical protein n=1 Tax=Sandarakinorhabdus limnophila TaxID=210512 RepID=UPI0037CB1187